MTTTTQRRSRGLVLALAGVVTAAAACGGRSARDASPELADLGPAWMAIDGLAGRRCEYLNGETLPRSLDQVARPGTRGSTMLWGVGAAPADTLELSVRYAADGTLDWVRPLRSNMAAGRVQELERLLSAGLEHRAPADWGFRLRFVAGSLDRVLPSVVCRPEETGSVPRVMTPVATGRELFEANQVRRSHIPVVVHLDGYGRVIGVRLVQATGSRLLDDYALELARGMSFRPKLHDGVGVPSQTTVNFRYRR